MREKFRSLPRSLLLLLMTSASALLAGCQLTPATEEAKEVDRQKFGVSILAVNLFNIMNMPETQDGVFWQTRYANIFKWMKDTGTFPDVIALQEAPAFWSCPTDARRLPDYAAIDFLLDGIRDASGEQYRIAYLIAGKPGGVNATSWVGRAPAQFCSQQGDRALLYRPSRVRNVIDRPSGTQAVISPYVEPFPRATYLARSVQCCSPAADRADVCQLIDGPLDTPAAGHFEYFMGTCATPLGVAWKRERKSMQGEDLNKPRADAVFSRLELISEPGNYIHIYNVHRGWGVDPDPTASPADMSGEGNINQLVTDMEARFLSQDNPPLYPPILVGDFNKETEHLGGMFPQFEMGMWGPPWPEVMGALFGKSDVFRAKHKAFANSQATIPRAVVANDCYDETTLISDHCGIFFRVEPSQR
jgi:hypothetical protein